MKESEANYADGQELTEEQLKEMANMPKLTGRMKRNYQKQMGAFKMARDLGFFHPEVIEFRETRRREGREMHENNIKETKERLEKELQARKESIIASMQERPYYTDEQIQEYVDNWEAEQRQSYWHS